MKICFKCKNKPVKSRTAKYCVECSIEVQRENGRKRTMKYLLKNNMIQKPGVGTGGNNAKGKDDSQYKTGITQFHKIKHRLKEQIRYCQRCEKDLKDAEYGQWCIHHKDHDRTNNDISNFELLCITCHNKEHDVVMHFKWFRDYLENESRSQETSKHVESSSEDCDIVRACEKSQEN